MRSPSTASKFRIALGGMCFLVAAITWTSALLAADDAVAPPAVPATSSHVLTISVSDAQGAPIHEFLVLAGTPAGSVTSEAFKKRTGAEAVNWQPHTVRKGKEGNFSWPLKPGYQVMKLRIEAPGFRPVLSEWIKRGDDVRQLTFKLVNDLGSEHRLLQPDGQPAAGAVIAVTLPQKDAVIDGGRLRGIDQPPPENNSDRWRRPTFIKTDDSGRFRLPAESDPAAAVLLVHESGALELPWDTLQAELEPRLRRWGRIEGQMQWRDRVGVSEPIQLSITRNDYGYPGQIAQRAETVSDALGRFVFERVLPGRAQLSRPTHPRKSHGGGRTSVNLPGLVIHPVVNSGEPTAVLLGGRGRIVQGRLTGRDTWEKVSLHMQPDAPHFGFAGDDEIWDAYGVFQQSAIGPLFFRRPLAPDADGSFQIPDVLPGHYQLRVTAPGVEDYAATLPVNLEAEMIGEAPMTVSIGEIGVAQAQAK